jgi:hypothetical protein
MRTVLYYLECQIPAQYLESYLDWRVSGEGTFKEYLIAKKNLIFAYTLLVAAIDDAIKELSKTP